METLFWMSIPVGIIVIIAIVGNTLNYLIDKEETKELKRIFNTETLEHMVTFKELKYTDGLDKSIEEDRTFSLYATEEKIVLRTTDGKHPQYTFEIPAERVERYALMTDKQIIKFKKNVAGKAIVGGLLLGGIGAIAGGAHGVAKDNTKEVSRGYLIVNYKNKNDELSAISFFASANPSTLAKYNNFMINLAKKTNAEYIPVEELVREDGQAVVL